MDHKIESAFQRIILRPLTREESEHMRIVRNRFSQWFGYSEQISAEDQEKWYTKYLMDNTQTMFSIFHKATGQWIGAAGIYAIDREKKICEVGRIVIDPELRPEKGLGFDAITCICCVAFEKLGIEFIKAEVYSDNIPARTNDLRAGFQIVGIEKMSDTRDNLLIELKKNEFIYHSEEC